MPDSPTPPGRDAIPAKVWRFAERWMADHDADGDGRLVRAEWERIDDRIGVADLDENGEVTTDELARYVAGYGAHRRIRLMPAGAAGIVLLPSFLPPSGVGAHSAATTRDEDSGTPPDAATNDSGDSSETAPAEDPSERRFYVRPSRLPLGLPDWFLKADRDGDGQLTLSEFAQTGSASPEKEFAAYDRNRDGLVTPAEILFATGRTGQSRKAGLKTKAPVASKTPSSSETAADTEHAISDQNGADQAQTDRDGAEQSQADQNAPEQNGTGQNGTGQNGDAQNSPGQNNASRNNPNRTAVDGRARVAHGDRRVDGDHAQRHRDERKRSGRQPSGASDSAASPSRS